MLFGGDILDIGAMQTGAPSVPVKTTAKPRYCKRWGGVSQANLAVWYSVFS